MLGYFIGTVMIILSIYLAVRITYDFVIRTVMKHYFLIPKRQLSTEVVKMIEEDKASFAVTLTEPAGPARKPKFSVVRRKADEPDKIK